MRARLVLVLLSTVACGDRQASSADGSAADGGVTAVPDGGPDIHLADAAVAGAPPYCPTHGGAIFCADFDAVAKVEQGWSAIATGTGSGAPVLDTQFFRSRPAAALFEVPRGAPPDSRLELRKSGLPNMARYRFGFDYWPRHNLDSAPGAYVRFSDACALAIYADGRNPEVFEEYDAIGSTGKVFTLAQAIASDGFGRVEVEIDWNRATFDVKLYGTSALKEAGTLAGSCTRSGTFQPEIDIGPHYFGTSTLDDTELRYDNVLVEAF